MGSFIRPLVGAFLISLFLQGCAHQLAAGSSQTGKASWYGGHHNGNRTASGEIYNMNALTAAHRTLPFGSVVEVKSLSTGRSVQVRINDRGPFSGNRIIDISKAAAEKIGMIQKGVDKVRIEVVSTP